MKKSLVTGGAGFIGSHVVGHLINLGHEVVVLDDLSGGFADNIPQGAHFVLGSINDNELVSQLFAAHEFTYVYHLAAYAAEGLSHFIRHFNYQNNLIGSINLINAAVKYKVECFVFTSSIAVYGTNVLPMVETAHPQPEDPYGIAKYAVELDLKSAHELFGLNYVIFRPHNVYGEHQNIGDRYRNVIGIFMNQILQGKPMTIYGDGSQSRAFSYIDDVAPHIALSGEMPETYNQVFNIGSEKHCSVKELAEKVSQAMEMSGTIRFCDARSEVEHAFADHSKLRSVYGLQNEQYIDLDRGLQKMATWVKEKGARRTPKFQNIELIEKLPQVWLED